MTEPTPGLFSLVLHTHLPWLAHHGRWPVGEEWLYQSWSAAYLPLIRVLRTLAAEDRAGLVTLGMTPVVTAQLDDPYCLDGMHHWLANWGLRAQEATTLPSEALRTFGIREQAEADRALVVQEGQYRDAVIIATKVSGPSHVWFKSPKRAGMTALDRHNIMVAVEDSLRKLQTDYIDLYLAHWPDAETDDEESLAAFARLKEAGKVRAIGCSNLDAEQLQATFDAAAKVGVDKGILSPEQQTALIDATAESLRGTYAELLAHGVEIYEYTPAFLHAKVAVVDGIWATVGSSNIDPLSLLVNLEANVVVLDAGFAARLAAEIDTALAVSSRVSEAGGQGLRAVLRRAVVAWFAYVFLRVAGAAGRY